MITIYYQTRYKTGQLRFFENSLKVKHFFSTFKPILKVMAGNTIGNLFRLTSFGESHGLAIGGVIDGCPSGLKLNLQFIQNELDRRKPNRNSYSSQRNESDKIHFLSGLLDDTTIGAPIAFVIQNENQKPDDYEELKNVFRPSHADFTYQQKYGIRDYKGGGRSSARETISRVVAGAIAKQFLSSKEIVIQAFVKQIGDIELSNESNFYSFEDIESSAVRCPEKNISAKMEKLISKTKSEDDTLGGIIHCSIFNAPIGLGEPVFDKFQADLAKAMMSINGAKGFEYGSGFFSAKMKGSEHNDLFFNDNGNIRTKTNHSGGIQGGITNGEEIYFNIAFKPAPTIMKPQISVDYNGNEVVIEPKGRHDVCYIPRAVPIVEAMAAMVTIDHYLRLK